MAFRCIIDSRARTVSYPRSSRARLTAATGEWQCQGPPRCGCSSMVEQKPSKLTTRVRFPSPAPNANVPGHTEVLAHARRIAERGDSASHALTALNRAATWRACRTPGEVAEWLKAADCKSARASVRWFESSPLHHSKFGQLAIAIGCGSQPEGC